MGFAAIAPKGQQRKSVHRLYPDIAIPGTGSYSNGGEAWASPRRSGLQERQRRHRTTTETKIGDGTYSYSSF
jgi:hypothetical protein